MTKKLYKMMNWPVIEEIIYSESQDPHATLGPHVQGNGTLIQAFFPGAQKVTLQLTKDMTEKEMELADDDGFLQSGCLSRMWERTGTLCPMKTAVWKPCRMPIATNV